MRTEKEIKQKIQDLEDIKFIKRGSARHYYNQRIELLKWVLGK